MSTAERPVLAVNCGSSSLKFGLYSSDGNKAGLLWGGEAEEIGGTHGSFSAGRADGSENEEKISFKDHAEALAHVFELLRSSGLPKPEGAGHRFVHGGPKLREHCLLDAATREDLDAASAFAPLHMPAALAALDAVEKEIPGTPQAICLDTAFHWTMPDVSRTYPLPQAIRDHGVQRYGFHGLSIESILAQMESIPRRLIVCHLGGGGSVTAILEGNSIDTSMGMTPTAGVMMATRTGDLDPGILVYLMRSGYEDADKLERLFDKQSGLLGVSGLSSDVRTLTKSRKENELADLALRMFCYQVRKTIGAMVVALGGVDRIVFAGGIGEHNPDLRNEICDGLAFMQLPADAVCVVPAKENEQLARITVKLMSR